ncbi:SMC-Scp complex subunit ScpB [Vreelandella populi]|uniref:SMC-Scp complex subunit ScpB n=1 Tax=Vreelandella populi TaxID=2498858 RepID=A0A433L9H2_9GAMM|nr:SMC-Scp complex subunit ScpB [Halomonas populi]RUR36934.1 SMC-Scp complex subunit ScpB [Halomonas populi]RUR44095.1 SMC-Scp complex subunit ScpB [Halomonas populi]RUR53552.1 SMC-Scp complex subunit ScpB [Halomonas populi]
MRDTTLDDIIEAALLAAGEPLALERLETLFLEDECPARRELRDALARLSQRHKEGALELVETASGFQLRIRPRLSHWVSRLWDERPQRYSRALLETLALVAYRQPVTRGDIEEVRGVSVSSSIMRTLMERGWIRVVGHRDVPGRPAVYATTRSFLDDFGLKTLDALPPMHELANWEDMGDTEASSPQEARALSYADNDEETLEEILDETSGSVQDAPPETAEIADEHAETALTQPLSFADLEARLAARAQRSNDDSARTQTNDMRSDDHDSEQ